MVHKNYHKRNIEHGKFGGQLKLRLRFENKIGGWFNYLIVSKNEMSKILRGTGWKISKIIKDNSPTYIAVIKKS